jgi:hypothetical protein
MRFTSGSSVDLCLEVSFVFNLFRSFPLRHSQHGYVGKVVYGININVDGNPAEVMALITDTK